MSSSQALKVFLNEFLAKQLNGRKGIYYAEYQVIESNLDVAFKAFVYKLPQPIQVLERFITSDDCKIDEASLYNVSRYLQETSVALIFELGADSQVLFRVITNKESGYYVRSKAIKLLGERRDKSTILAVAPILLDFSFLKAVRGFDSFLDDFFKVIVDLELKELLPKIILLHKPIKKEALKEHEDRKQFYIRRGYKDSDYEVLVGSPVIYDDQWPYRFIIVRASLGDIDVLDSIIKLNCYDSYDIYKAAEQALASLVKAVGVRLVLAKLIEKQPDDIIDEAECYWFLINNGYNYYVKYWALSQYLLKVDLSNVDILNQLMFLLEDKTGYLSETVVGTLLKIPKDLIIPLIESNLAKDDYAPYAKYCMLYVLLQLEHPIDVWITKIPDVFVPLPNFISNDLRKAIVSYWVPESSSKSDVRWYIEYNLLAQAGNLKCIMSDEDDESTESLSGNNSIYNGTQEAPYNAQPLVEQLVKNLKNRGIVVERFIDFAEKIGQGGSTYYVIEMPAHSNKTELVTNIHTKDVFECTDKIADNLHISQIGSFIYYCAYESHQTKTSGGSNCRPNDLELVSNAENLKIYQEEAEKLGLTFLSNEVLQYIIPNLNIYYFGSRKPLSVDNLLFYWQD